MNIDTTARRAQLRLGTILCRQWRLESILGCGETAVVYAAVPLGRRRQPLAIRILHPEFSADENVRARFFGEAYASNQVDHEGAVPVLGHGLAEDGCAFLVMERVIGETLSARLSRGTLPLHSALELTDDLLDVLAAAHAHGIVHRNLEPRHLLITEDGCLRVLGFGNARVREVSHGSGREGSFRGAAGYAPPEQLCGRSDPKDARSDVYAAGAILYQMLSGRPVHPAASSTENIALTIAAAPRPLRDAAPHLPKRLADVVDRALSYDPEARWPDAMVLQSKLRAALAELDRTDPHAAQSAVRRRTSSLAPWTFSRAAGGDPGPSLPQQRPGFGWLRLTLLFLVLTPWWTLSESTPAESRGADRRTTAAASHLAQSSVFRRELPRPLKSALHDPMASRSSRLICDVRSLTPSRLMRSSAAVQPHAEQPHAERGHPSITP